MMAGQCRSSRASATRCPPGFFRELGIAIARGREFDAQDRPGAPQVAVVNESLSRRLWGESDPWADSGRRR